MCYNQVRRAIQQMMFPNKTFNWPRHIAIAFFLLTLINLLVIFAPNILGIFGVIGRLALAYLRCILTNPPSIKSDILVDCERIFIFMFASPFF